MTIATQPGLGLAGLTLVVPVALVLAVGVEGAERSLVVLGPLVTFALPVVAMIGFWWSGWPGSHLRRPWWGLADTLVIAIAGVLLAAIGGLVVGGDDLFPDAMPLASAAFVAMLQLTLVSEGWPLRRLRPLRGGVAALAVPWAVALVLYVVATGYEALLVLVAVWQVWLFVAWQGWPFADRRPRWLRLVAANAVVIAGAALTYAAVHGLGTGTISAAAGSFIAAALVIGMLFEGWLGSRAVTLAASVALAVVLYLVLTAYADGIDWTRASGDEWITHVSLNAIGVAVILHVAIGRRWPFAA